jgi:hypothetical protein
MYIFDGVFGFVGSSQDNLEISKTRIYHVSKFTVNESDAGEASAM